ncbi:alkaline phosphatase D [Nocardioides zeae]|uniref:Alkaline phosphatase D n=2 Tax=Nocardioides zeae TaxID=1457234 RepID=A0ACC6IJR1_9ACTN|nr:alkaline phosphatase D family protein [Nocardioides zeae]MDQ1102722.1 alkaline phosphatase D [Nocardioides zeae]MDR6173502.1 alkaline phosphatase D [Nocardioides zeae]MDR6210908.1 alkaline phosphatase D [Nocardioides zeae]
MTETSSSCAPRPELPPVRRRTVLAGSAVAGAAVAGAAAVADPWGSPAAQAATSPYFQHGVASGDPLPDRVVLWTRVTPQRDATPGSGRGGNVTVEWQVATDTRFLHLAARGTYRTGPAADHTVKVDATGLRPGTRYVYRFLLNGVPSPVGRTRTAPAATAVPDRLRLGVVSCANLQAGYFHAYRHLAQRDDLDAILHLGDYLYEYGPGEYGLGRDNVDVRRHVPAREMVSLADHRQRHAQYKQDPDLQWLHSKYPFIVTWDDHETTNDAWRGGAENHQPATEGDWATRRARAHRAYDEWMPVRMNGTAALGDGTRLFRSLRFGRLAQLSMLDLRTYRDEQVAYPAVDARVSDPARTITGRAQLDWLKDALGTTQVQWKLVGNPVMIAPVTFAQLPTELLDPVNDVTHLLPRDGSPYNVDQWDGYTDDRRELFTHIRDRGIRDTVFVTGDIHSGWAADLPYDVATYPLGRSAGVEFVASSVTSNNLKDILGVPPRTGSLAVESAIRLANRHVRYLDFDSHGYSVLDVTSARVQMDWYVTGPRDQRGAGSTHAVSFQTLAGTNTISRAAGPVGGR